MIPATRRYDLDALRVGAFLLLILYHLGMFYVPWDWHVKSEHLGPALEPIMGVVNPWRLTLLFVISGVATRFMAAKFETGFLAKQRSSRLLIPLLFGMLIIVAPQSWAEVVEKQGYPGSLWDFWPRYLTFDTSFGIIVPTYNHLWFVAYLWVYTIVALAARPLAPFVDRIARQVLAGPGLFLVPALVFGIYQATAHRAWGDDSCRLGRRLRSPAIRHGIFAGPGPGPSGYGLDRAGAAAPRSARRGRRLGRHRPASRIPGRGG